MVYSDELIDRIAEVFKVLSEPMRLKILDSLRHGEKNVSELIKLTGSQQANVSKHLGIMKKAGVVNSRRKDGPPRKSLGSARAPRSYTGV